MRNVITLNKNRQEAGNTVSDNQPQSTPTTKPAGQPVIQVRQNKLKHQPYSEQEHATVSFNDWTGNTRALELAEEDMNDPDLTMDFSGGHGYMLQPG